MRQDGKSSIDKEMFGSGIQATSGESEGQLFADLGRALWRRRILLATILVLGGIAGYAATYFTEVRYTAYAQVMIETRTGSDQSFAPGISGLPTSLTALESELEVLKSTDLVEGVVDRLELWADTEFVPPPDTTQPLISTTMVKDLVFDQLAKLGLIEPPQTPVIEVVEDEAALARDTAVRNALGMRTIDQVGNISAVYTIAFTSRNPGKAALLANTLAEEYINRQVEVKLRSLERSQKWLTDRTADVQQRLAELSVELENHLLATPFSVEDVQTMKVSRNSLEGEQATVQAASVSTGRVLTAISDFIEGDPEQAAALIEAPSTNLLLAMNSTDGTGEERDAALRAALEGDVASLQSAQTRRTSRLADLSTDLEALTAQLVSQALHDARTRQIENDIRVNEAIYQDFVSQLSRRTQQDEYLDPDSRIISYARAPEFASEPRRARTSVMVAMMALFVLSGLIMLREVLQDRLRTVVDYEGLTRTPLVGIIPRTPRRNAPLKAFGAKGRNLQPSMVKFARKLYNSIVAEHRAQPKGKDLRGRLGTQARPKTSESELDLPTIAGERGQVIAGIGALSQEGVSTMNLLIAAACGDAGERVVLLDCDFWKSPFRKLAVTDPIQYTDALFNHDYVDRIAVETGEVGVDVIAAPLNLTDPTALLLSSDFKHFIKYLTERYDRVILDAPPLLNHIDTAALYRIADTVILGARWNHTRAGALNTVIKVLNDVGVAPSAVVATRVDLKRASAYGDEVFNYARAIR